MKKTIILIILILLLSFSFAEEFYPTAVAGLKTEVRLYGFGTISDLKDNEEINFQTVTFPDSSFQKIRVIREVLTIDGKTIFPTYSIDEFENKYVNFKIPYNGEFNYELVAEVNTQALIHEMEDYNIGAVNPKVSEFLNRTEKVESDSTQILTLTQNKLYSNSFFESLTDTIFWVNDYVNYAEGSEFNQYYLLQKSAVETLISKKGVCDEFSNLAASMLRAKGIPTRLAIGITYDGQDWGNHAWLEVYHNSFGWIPSDPTFREPGFVDATHIRLGSFADVSQSIATASYPKTASIIFQTQTLPEVTVIDKNYFTHVELNSNSTELLTNRWNDFNISIKNLTNSTLTIPIKIRENYPNILFDQKVQSAILKSGEEKSFVFKIYPQVALEENEFATGTFVFDSLSEPYTAEFKIKPSELIDNGEVKIVDVTPIAFENKLILEINIANLTSINQTIDLNLNTPDKNLYWSETTNAFTIKTFSKEIQNYPIGEYILTINTPTQKYIQHIFPIKSKSQEPIIIIKDTKIVQKVITGDENNESGMDETNIAIIGLAILTAITITLIFLLATRKRYV
jgi:transglutaminase-like putative cysteine protease